MRQMAVARSAVHQTVLRMKVEQMEQLVKQSLGQAAPREEKIMDKSEKVEGQNQAMAEERTMVLNEKEGAVREEIMEGKGEAAPE